MEIIKIKEDNYFDKILWLDETKTELFAAFQRKINNLECEVELRGNEGRERAR